MPLHKSKYNLVMIRRLGRIERYRGCRMKKKEGSLVIITHSDDAAIALGHILSKRYLPGPLDVSTVVSFSFHFEESLLPQPSMSTVPEMRLSEDRCFCKRIGASFYPLGFWDNFGLCKKNETLSVEAIEDCILVLIEKLQKAVVVCAYPNGITHPHHDLVFRATTSAIGKMKETALFFVDDLPYSRIPVGEKVFCNGIEYTPVIIELSEEELDIKFELMKIYKSQLKRSYFETVSETAPGDVKKRYSETLWLPKSNKFSELTKNVYTNISGQEDEEEFEYAQFTHPFKRFCRASA